MDERFIKRRNEKIEKLELTPQEETFVKDLDYYDIPDRCACCRCLVKFTLDPLERTPLQGIVNAYGYGHIFIKYYLCVPCHDKLEAELKTTRSKYLKTARIL